MRSDSSTKVSVALVHEWLTTYGGSEMVLEQIASIFSDAPIHTLIHNPDRFQSELLLDREIHVSMIRHLPWAKTQYRHYLPLFPLAIEQFDLGDHEWIISSSHAVAKGVLTKADQHHLCYCHTPMRYAWDLTHTYLKESGLNGYSPLAIIAKLTLHYLRMWDVSSASRVDAFVANSEYVAQRIRKIYGRPAYVIHPPVHVERFDPSKDRDDFYLTASRLVPYKRIDLIARAFDKAKRKLIIVGDGPIADQIKAIHSEWIDYRGYQADHELSDLMSRCKAFVFAADEDFGIVPVEAQAAGAPVIALGKGGALETIVEDHSGVFFDKQDEEHLIHAVERFEADGVKWCSAEIAEHASAFSADRFKQDFKEAYDVLRDGLSKGLIADRVIEDLRACAQVKPSKHDAAERWWN